jgi:hypothetical protein
MEKYWQRLLFKWFLISYLVFIPYLAYQKCECEPSYQKCEIIYLVVYPIFIILAYRIYKIEVKK